jgi:hypothetical protein
MQQTIERFAEKGADESKARSDAKDALIKAVSAIVKRGDLLDDDFSGKGIERVSNKKLQKLLKLAETVQEAFGTKAALVDRCLEVESRQKDAGYRQRLESFRLPELYSHFLAAQKRTR